jgi:hypothetical protein
MESYRILVIEEDPAIGQSLLDGFKQHGRIHAEPIKGTRMAVTLPIALH